MVTSKDTPRIGLGLLGGPEVPRMVELAQQAEARGFESVWVAETRLTRDALVPCAAIALGTARIKVATGIINVYTRGAVLSAVSFVSLAEVAPGRIIMGLGPGSPLVLAPQGFEFDKPITRLRETIDVVQGLLRGEAVTLVGETMTVNEAQLEARAPGPQMPLYLGVTGPRALELAGAKADGVMLNAFLPPAYTRRAIETIGRGAMRANRSLTDIDIAGAVVVSLDEDGDAARQRSRAFIAMYLSLFPNLAQETGLAEARVAEIRQRFERDGADAASALIDDAVVNDLTASGTAHDCRRKLNEYRAAGMHLPIIFPLDPTTAAAIDALGL